MSDNYVDKRAPRPSGESGRLVETFNTHRMSDEIIRALAIGRDDELAQIVPAIRRAAEAPQGTMPALIVYGERGSGKSFLMRLVQMACAEIESTACVLLPEEQYNLRAPQQLLQIVTAHLRGDDWAQMSWKLDPRNEETAWTEELDAFHATLDARFGAGQGVAVVLLENFDTIVEKLFGTQAPKVKLGAKKGPTLARRHAEERLRKLLNARGGRYLLIASATGTVDMDYERPLFKGFQEVDLIGWSADTAIKYFNKRRELENQPLLTPGEEARARAIIEFIGGNVRLTQLLGTALTTPDAKTIAETLDELVDKLADYYRQRLDALPGASASVLDALIRGGEPVTQTALAQRMGGDQRQIADAFSYLTRGRLVSASTARKGTAQHYRVRDRLFVHFYRRRYGQASSLAAIAELLEQFFTPDEREAQIREHLARGEFEEARAFGRLPLESAGSERGYCNFRDCGITDGPPRPWFALAGLSDTETEAAQQQLRDRPDQAFEKWRTAAQQAATPLQKSAATALAAVAASRNGYDRIAQRELEDGIKKARDSADIDALIVALHATASFSSNRERGPGWAKLIALAGEIGPLAEPATHAATKAAAYLHGAFHASHQKRCDEAERLSRLGLAIASTPFLLMDLSYQLAWALSRLKKTDEALATLNTLEQLADTHRFLKSKYDALGLRAVLLSEAERHSDSIPHSRAAAYLAGALGLSEQQASDFYQLATAQRETKDVSAALLSAQQGLSVALAAEPPIWTEAGWCAWLAVDVMLDKDGIKPRDAALELSKQAVDYADRAQDRDLLYTALNQLIYLAALRPIPEAIPELAKALDGDSDLSLLGDNYDVRENWPWAAAKANGWTTALAIARRHPQLMANAEVYWPAHLHDVGKRWAKIATQSGRAAAYSEASEALPAIKALLEMRAEPGGGTLLTLTLSVPARLTASLVASCGDAGLLRDLSDLMTEYYGEAANDSANRLREFAALHEAVDKEAHLQTIDPDLATAMRLILNLPEPKDTVAKKGRQRSR